MLAVAAVLSVLLPGIVAAAAACFLFSPPPSVPPPRKSTEPELTNTRSKKREAVQWGHYDYVA